MVRKIYSKLGLSKSTMFSIAVSLILSTLVYATLLERTLASSGAVSDQDLPTSNSNEIASNKGSIAMTIEFEPLEGMEDAYNVKSSEITSDNAQICPSNDCEFLSGNAIDPLYSNLSLKSDGLGYLFEGTLFVDFRRTISGAEVIASKEYNLIMELDKSSKSTEVKAKEGLVGTMRTSSTNESSTEPKIEYLVDGILETDSQSPILTIKALEKSSSGENISERESDRFEVSPSESTSTKIPDFKNYENTDHKIQAQVPADWEVSEDDPTPDDSVSEIAYFLTPLTESDDQYHENVGILSEELLPGYSNLTEYLNYSIDAYAGGLKNFALNSSNSNAEFMGKPAYSMVYTSSMEDGDDDLTLKTLEVGSTIGNKSYYVSYNAQPQNYEKYLPQVEQIIDSIKILNESSLDLTPLDESD